VPPRTWTYASHLLRTLTPAECADEGLLRDALGGYLPPAWCELLIASRATWSQPLPVDVRALLAGPDGESARQLRTFRERGQTDRLDEITQRVLGIVQGPEVGVLAGQQRFSLGAFEALLAELPGDQRERLQEALAHNAVATALLDVAPLELLQNYHGSAAEQKVRAWRADPLRAHRLGLLVTSLRAHLEQHPKLAEVRRSNVVRINLGLVLSQLGERWAMPLVDTLLRLGITPVRPS
jgi:hypothetical protein